MTNGVFALFDATALERAPHDALRTLRVVVPAEEEPAVLDRPAREQQRELDDVVLVVAVVDADGVKLHELAGVVFVQTVRSIFVAALQDTLPTRQRRLGHVVVEIEEHRRVLRRRHEERLEVAEDVLAEHFAFPVGDVVPNGALVDVDVEVIAPEVDHDLLELTFAVDRAQDDGAWNLAPRKVLDAIDLALAHARERDAVLAFAGGPDGRHVFAQHPDEVGPVELEALERREALVDDRIGNARRLELAVDPAFDAQLAHLGDVPGTRAERGPAQEVADARLGAPIRRDRAVRGCAAGADCDRRKSGCDKR